MGFLKKRESPAGKKGKGVVPADKESAKLFPALWEHLTTSEWPGGEERRTSTVLLFVDGDKCKACLNDRDGGMVAFVTGDTFRGLLAALEEGLQKDTLDWRAQQAPGKKGGPRGG